MNNLSIYQIMHNELKGINSLIELEKRKSMYRTKLLKNAILNPFEYIVNIVCSYYRVDMDNVINSLKYRDNRQICFSRQLIMFFLKKYTKLKFEEIALKVNKKNHATVIHAINLVNGLRYSDKKIALEVYEIDKKIKRRLSHINYEKTI